MTYRAGRSPCDRCVRCGLPIYQRTDGSWTLVYAEHDQPGRCFGELGDLDGAEHRPKLILLEAHRS